MFDRLRNFFRAMFGLDAQLQVDPNMQTVATIFNKIKAGEFADIKAPTETRNVEEVNMALLENDGNVTSARFSMDMMSTFTKHFGKTMFDDPNLKLTLSELEMLSDPNRYDEYNNKLVKIYKTAFSRMYDELGSKIKIYTDLASNTNDTALKDRYNLLAQRAAKARLFLNGGRVKLQETVT